MATRQWAYSQRALEVSPFQFAETYPNQAQIKFLVKGGKGRPINGTKKIEISGGAEVSTFKENGQGELVVKTQECVYDEAEKTISSPGKLQMHTADNRSSLEGVGFLYRQTQSTLFISNQVQTILRPEESKNPGASPGQVVTISSEKFRYANDSGEATYQGRVHLSSTNLEMNSGMLRAIIPSGERQLKNINASEQVEIDYRGIKAFGETAVYFAETGLANITGSPRWMYNGNQGSGDELTIDRTNQVFRANGHAQVNLPGQSLAAMSPAGTKKENSAGEENRLLRINSDYYEFRTNPTNS